MTFKYIQIIEEDYAGKTRKFTVKANSPKIQSILGTIQWESDERGYVYAPWTLTSMKYLTAYEMEEIASFIRELMAERKLSNQSNPQGWKHEQDGDKGSYSK